MPYNALFFSVVCALCPCDVTTMNKINVFCLLCYYDNDMWHHRCAAGLRDTLPNCHFPGKRGEIVRWAVRQEDKRIDVILMMMLLMGSWRKLCAGERKEPILCGCTFIADVCHPWFFNYTVSVIFTFVVYINLIACMYATTRQTHQRMHIQYILLCYLIYCTLFYLYCFLFFCCLFFTYINFF
jgi:hypothetical protein